MVLVRGMGVAVARHAVPGVDDMLSCLSLLCERLPAEAVLSYLQPAQVDELIDWDAEKHRQAVDAAV
jgi:rhamnose utilization protein RhaD (predicted bifunctional aldolase and dehydrogenase)